MSQNIKLLLLIIIIIIIFTHINNIYESFIPWNNPTRINNYIYDIRGYPWEQCNNDKPCMYFYNKKYNTDGSYTDDNINNYF